MAIVLPFIVVILVCSRIVPQKCVFIVERLGKYSKTLGAGYHFLIPFIDRVAYKHSLKELALNVESQTCITKDNIAVEVDPRNTPQPVPDYAGGIRRGDGRRRGAEQRG